MPTPPSCLPDWLAVEYEPRTWFGVLFTVLGIAGSGVMMGQSVAEFVAEPINTEVELEPTRGSAYTLTLRCTNALGCSIDHKYDDPDCAAEVNAGTVTLSTLETAEVQLCGSPVWGDGVRVSVPLGLVTGALVAPVEYTLNDNDYAGLPYSAPIADAATGKAAAVSLGRTREEDTVKDESTTYWQAVAAGSSNVNCAPLPAVPVGVAVPAALCYLLTIDPLTTKLTRKRAFTPIALLEAWGGAYGFVFGLIGTLFFWIGGLCSCCGMLRGAAKPGGAEIEVGGAGNQRM